MQTAFSYSVMENNSASMTTMRRVPLPKVIWHGKGGLAGRIEVINSRSRPLTRRPAQGNVKFAQQRH